MLKCMWYRVWVVNKVGGEVVGELEECFEGGVVVDLKIVMERYIVR